MPNYLYRCLNCPHSFELWQSFEDKPKVRCPSCRKHKLYKDVSGVGAYVYQEPKTIGHQAHRNTERNGKCWIEDKTKNIEEKKKKRIENAPFWRPGTDKVKPELLSATPEEKNTYVEKGILPKKKYEPKKKSK